MGAWGRVDKEGRLEVIVTRYRYDRVKRQPKEVSVWVEGFEPEEEVDVEVIGHPDNQ